MFRNDIVQSAAEQLAKDYCCAPEDFLKKNNVVKEAFSADGQRSLTDEPVFFRMATFGTNAVIAAAEEILPFARDISNCDGLSLFDGKGIAAINRAAAPKGHIIGMINQYYLPEPPTRTPDRCGYRIEVFEEEEIRTQLYPYYKGYDNALLYHGGKRRDVLAVCAISGRTILGMAGASNDSPMFWQIGIDVLLECRGRGLASILVATLANEVFHRGAVPYYGTWPGNIASHNVALKSGFRPAWTELFTVPLAQGG